MYGQMLVEVRLNSRIGRNYMKLNTKAYAITFGVFWGLAVFAFTWGRILMEGRSNRETLLGEFYRGYRLTPLGSLAGLAWGFADGFFGGLLFAWMYNRLSERLNGAERLKQKDKEHHRQHHRQPDHGPWLYALMHRVPGIHA